MAERTVAEESASWVRNPDGSRGTLDRDMAEALGEDVANLPSESAKKFRSRAEKANNAAPKQIEGQMSFDDMSK